MFRVPSTRCRGLLLPKGAGGGSQSGAQQKQAAGFGLAVVETARLEAVAVIERRPRCARRERNIGFLTHAMSRISEAIGPGSGSHRSLSGVLVVVPRQNAIWSLECRLGLFQTLMPWNRA
jgi:hypothetical protein